MYRYSVDNAVTYLPSDIILFRESPFAAWMERLALENPDHGIPPDTDSHPPRDIAERQDDLVDTLRAEGRDVVLVDWERTEPERRADTLDAMRSGADFIVNGRLALGPLSGDVNMLMRTSGFSELGDFLYIPCDTQGGTGLNAGFRLAFFADLLQRLQGQLPPQLLVIYPDAAVVPLQTDDYIHYYRAVKERFMQAMSSFRKHRMPDPAESAHFGRWSECAAEVLKQRAQSAGYQGEDSAEPSAAESGEGAALKHAAGERTGDEAAPRVEASRQAQATVPQMDEQDDDEQVAYAVADMPVAAVAGQPPMRDVNRGAVLHEMNGVGAAAEMTSRAAGAGLTLVEQARSLSPDAYRSRKAPGRTPNLAHFPVPETPPAARGNSPTRSRDSAEVLENLEFIGSSQPAPLYDSRPLRPAAPRRESLRPAEPDTRPMREQPDGAAVDAAAADTAARAGQHEPEVVPEVQDDGEPALMAVARRHQVCAKYRCRSRSSRATRWN
ncbi:MAG: hypothetical protein R3E54_12795 [Halioglobus sp.]